MKKILIYLIILPCSMGALSFVEMGNIPIQGVSFGSVHWGDYNNSGHLDLLITGDIGEGENRLVSQIYRNNGDGTFTFQEGIALPGVVRGKGVWGDFNNDGFLDIAVSGATTIDFQTRITKIYSNNQNGRFVDIGAILAGVRYSVVKWTDINRDGFLDLFVAGECGDNPIAHIYLNNGDESFSLLEDIVLSGSIFGDASFIDFNGNGYPDLVLTGSGFAKVYINNNGSGFTLANNINLPDVRDGSVAWGDYNNDGFSDLLITGMVGTIRICRVYKNVGGQSLVYQNEIVLPGIRWGQAIWADMNNDGRLDIVISGQHTNGDITKIFINAGANGFVEAQGLNLPGTRYASIEAVDVNNDGKLDLTICGLSEGERICKIFINQIDRINQRPLPPTELNNVFREGSVTLRWNNGSDNETNTNSLSYNVVLRKAGDPDFLIAPASHLNNGFRKLNCLGNAGYNNFITFHGVEIGHYQWAVQTIDSIGAGSVFSAWKNIQFMHRPVNITIVKRDDECVIKWDRVETATHYHIYGSKNISEDNWRFLGELTETQFVTPIQYQKYFFRVTAVAE